MERFLTVVEILAMHHVLIGEFGGSEGLRDLGTLEAAVYRPATGYYDDPIAEAAALMESLAINHPFIDGNKRVAFAAADLHLRLNGCHLEVDASTAHEFVIGLLTTGDFVLAAIEPWLREHTTCREPSAGR